MTGWAGPDADRGGFRGRRLPGSRMPVASRRTSGRAIYEHNHKATSTTLSENAERRGQRTTGNSQRPRLLAPPAAPPGKLTY
eukprot:6262018-Prymnesium_polylepis.1